MKVFTTKENNVILQPIFLRLAQIRGLPLLPNLQQLYCQPSFLHFHLLSPALRTIGLFTSGADEDCLDSFLSAVAFGSPALMNLFLLKPITKQAVLVIPYLQNLTLLSLRIPEASLVEPSLTRIGGLRRLEDLSLHLPSERLQMASLTGHVFGALKTLRITGASRPLQEMTEILKSASGSVLSVSLSLTSHASATLRQRSIERSYLRKSIQNICSRWEDSLRAITIRDPRKSSGPSIANLQPLLWLRNIESVDVAELKLSYTPIGLRGLVCTWTGIRSLRLPLGSEGLSLADFRWLIESCLESPPNIDKHRICTFLVGHG